MKNKSLITTLVLCIITIFVHIGLLMFQHNISLIHKHRTEYIATETIAVEIGKIICQNTYPQFDYSSLAWECFEMDDTWIVYCNEASADNITGGGFPEVHLTSSGEIIYLGLAK